MSAELNSESLIARVEDDIFHLSPNGLRVYIVNMQNLGPIANKNKSSLDPVTENFENLTIMSVKLGTGKRLDQDEMEVLLSIIKKCIISSNRNIM